MNKDNAKDYLPGGQGWCAQFQQDKEETKRLTKGMMR